MATSPDNKNFLSPIGFQFSIQKLPNVNYFCTSASVPSITLGDLDYQTPFINLPTPGDKLSFGQLIINFRIDEDMRNFREIYDWMLGIGVPDTFNQRHPRLRASMNSADPTVYSDASLLVLTNQYKPNVEVKFVDMYPVDLSSFEFNIEQNDIEYLTGSATFAYRKYELTTVT